MEKTGRISFRPVSLQQSLKSSLPFDIDLVINCLLFFLHIQKVRNPKIYLFILVYYTAIYIWRVSMCNSTMRSRVKI